MLGVPSYKQPLGVETVPLTYAIFRDLVACAKQLQSSTTQLAVQAGELTKAQHQLFPLRRENTRLVRANNAVHLQAMKVRLVSSGRFGFRGPCRVFGGWEGGGGRLGCFELTSARADR